MNKLHLDQHISQQYNQELSELRSRVLTMGGLVERQFTDGMTALLDHNAELGHKVATSDGQVNRMEVEIDEACTAVLARRQPTASDLRLVVTIIKTITDLERIGDEAEKLGKLAIKLADSGDSNVKAELEAMGKEVRDNLREALDAFAHLDAEAALRTAGNDHHIDAMHRRLQTTLIEQIKKTPGDVQNIMRVGWCVRAMERIGDHANNICEYVIYLVHGRDIRHLNPEAIQEKLSTH